METSTVSKVKKSKLLYATIFVDASRAYFYIQASSAASDLLCGDDGFQEATLQQHRSSLTSEMTLF